MRMLVCGSRDITDRHIVYNAISDSPWDPEVILHGGADGVDKIADRYARMQSVDIDPHPIPEWVWETVGSKAGPMRNGYMVGQADAVVAIWDGESPGTKNAIKQAEGEGLPVFRVVCEETEAGWSVIQASLIEDDQMCLEDFAGSG